MKAVLIDSDVILDALSNRQPFAKDSIQILTLCETKQIHGCITPVILSNLYYLLRKIGVSNSLILENFRNLLTNILFDVVPMDKKSIMTAIDSEFNDFEDALQNFSAENHADISVIITRNTKDFKRSNLSIMTPKEFLGTIRPH